MAATREKPVQIPGLYGGINTGAPRDRIMVSESPDMQNFTVIDGVLTKQTGYAANSGTIGGTADKPFLHGRHYGDSLSGNTRFWAFTKDGVFQKAALTDNWTDVTNSMVIDDGFDQVWTTCEIARLSDYKNYLIAVQNNTDPLNPHNSTLVLYADSPTSGLAALAGGDGYNDSDANHRCKQVIDFDGCLFLCGTYEEVAAATWQKLPFRVRWSNPGAFNTTADWNPSATGSLAGYRDFRDGYGGFVAAAKTLTKLVLFYQEAIYVGVVNDSTTEPFKFWPRVTGLGLYGPKLVAQAQDRLFFMGTDKQIYEYWGGLSPIPIGRNVRNELFDAVNKTASGGYYYRNRATAILFRDLQAIGFAVPTATSFPDTIWLWFYNDRRWEKIVLPAGHNITGWGEWQRPAGEDQENLVIVGDDNGSIFDWDYASLTWNGTAVDAYVTTGVLIIDLKHRFNCPALYLEASGDGAASSVTVSHKTENDSDYEAIDTLTVGTGWGVHKCVIAKEGYRHQFKFSNSSTTQKLKLGRIRIDDAVGSEVG